MAMSGPKSLPLHWNVSAVGGASDVDDLPSADCGTDPSTGTLPTGTVPVGAPVGEPSAVCPTPDTASPVLCALCACDKAPKSA
eukprot:CAMPEP_0194554490 /NCGR_PEP_ID=MMETSP0253-20130528/97764_1 /TAXON_ID=2966 /ORGANISM="Noctiluca scintillans" /LENGTH=82 /DNA_ID=CAMNT_0039401981 /DNA_START=834 /DNA_END=1082 /DNA_ORIENTATION=-